MILTICPSKDGDVEKLIIEGQCEAGYFFGFEPEVGTQTHRWAGFCISRMG